MLQPVGVERISVENSLLVERVLSQWTYDIKGKASFKDSTVGDSPMADFGAPGRIRFCREEFYDSYEGGVRVADQHEGFASLIEYEERACGPGLS